MDVFEKAAKTAKVVGESVVDSAKYLGNSIYNSTKEQSELASLKVQLSTIEKKLTDNYAKIGRKYVEYVEKCDTETIFDVTDILEEMKPELDKLAEVKGSISEKEAILKTNAEEKKQKKAQDEYESQKSKLDKALEMEIITSEEYDEKMVAVQARLDNYDALRKIDMQLEMGIITEEEYEEKIRKILG